MSNYNLVGLFKRNKGDEDKAATQPCGECKYLCWMGALVARPDSSDGPADKQLSEIPSYQSTFHFSLSFSFVTAVSASDGP